MVVIRLGSGGVVGGYFKSSLNGCKPLFTGVLGIIITPLCIISNNLTQIMRKAALPGNAYFTFDAFCFKFTFISKLS